MGGRVVRDRGMPIGVGETHVIQIGGLGHAGEGVGRIQGFTVFVGGAIPGDEVLVHIEEVRKNYGRGSVLEIRRPSPARRSPSCIASGDCGGCQLRHMAYQAQLQWKRRLVRDALMRIGDFADPQVRPVIGMKSPEHYRNKVHYPVAAVNGKLSWGFYRRSSHDLVSVEDCDNVHPLCNKAIQVVGPALNEHGLTAYDATSGRGLIRHIICRVSLARDELMVVLVTNGALIPGVQELVVDLKKALPELVSVAQNINEGQTSVVLGAKTRVIWGEPYLCEELNGLSFAISPVSFFQVNSGQAEVLARLVCEYSGAKEGLAAVDCYCGTGSFALHLARAGVQVVGVEEVPAAVADARLNAELNGISAVDFRVGRVENTLVRLLKGSVVDVAVIDPPRKGCDPRVLESIIHAQVPTLVYVSCNLGTLARDAAILNAGGYALQQIQPVDMFPHTSHVECVIGMQRKDA